MTLNIKDPETDRLARELAAVTGESLTVAARTAFAERLARVKARQPAGARADRLRAIIERGRRLPVLDERSAEEILGYDASGLPE